MYYKLGVLKEYVEDIDILESYKDNILRMIDEIEEIALVKDSYRDNEDIF